MTASLTSAALSYAMTGEATFNVLNLQDLMGGFAREDRGTEIWNSGLLELTVGNKGITGTIGTGGTDINTTTMKGFVKGLMVLQENMKIGGFTTNVDLQKALRAAFSQGKETSDYLQYLAIMSGKDKEQFDQALNAVAKTTQDGDGNRIITIGKNATNGEMDLAIILSHEAEHNGVVDGKQEQETQNAFMNHVNMASQLLNTYGAQTMSQGNAEEAKSWNTINDPLASEADKAEAREKLGKSFNSYDSSGDYWKIKEVNDRLIAEWDGRTDFTDENGNLIAPPPGASDELLNLFDKLMFYQENPAGKSSQNGDYIQALAAYKKAVSETNTGIMVIDSLAGFLGDQDIDLPWQSEGTVMKELSDSLPEKLGITRNRNGTLSGEGLQVGKSSLDITSLFLRGGDQRAREGKMELMSNSNLVSNRLFQLLHDPYVNGGINDLASGALIGDLSSKAEKDIALATAAGIKREPLNTLKGYFQTETLGNEGYKNRFEQYLGNETERLNNKVDLYQNWTMEAQESLSDKLGWGFLANDDGSWILGSKGNKISSLCLANAYMAAHELNVGIDTTERDKIAALNYLKDNSFIERNGTVNAGFATAYAEWLNSGPRLIDFGPTEIPTSHSNTGEVANLFSGARFLEGRGGGHSVVMDRLSDDRFTFNPWRNGNWSWGEDFHFSLRRQMRYTQTADFWRN